MLRRIIYFSTFIILFVPALSHAGILSTEWGSSPDSFITKKTRQLTNKQMKCIQNCAITANYTIFNNHMEAKFWFETNNKKNGMLKEVWLISEKFINKKISEHSTSQINLFNNFKNLYTKKYGEPELKHRNDTMELLGIITYIWKDNKRSNNIQLENWINQVRLKYKPL